MARRFLILDPGAQSREAVSAMLRERWPRARVDVAESYHSAAAGRSLAGYSAFVLCVGDDIDEALRWIHANREAPDPPPAVLVASHGGETAAVRAMKAGAADFLGRDGLTGERLVRAVEDALRERQAHQLETTSINPAWLRTTRFDVQTIGTPITDAAQIVPGYRVLRKIGEGGSAQVFLAERAHDGLQLVLKVLDPGVRDDAVFLTRFVQEYKLLAQIEEEYVARIFDQGFAGRHPYIAMEYFPGGDLKQRIRAGMTSLGALRTAAQIARALDAIHAQGIVHRDLKPQNIMFRDNGRPAILDFGLAKDLNADTAITRVGELVATPRYMSPEQCLGLDVDGRSDLYSLGIVLYEMLTGQGLIASKNPADLIYQHVHGAIPRLPPRLAGCQPIIDRLLAKKPAQRYASARDLYVTITV